MIFIYVFVFINVCMFLVLFLVLFFVCRDDKKFIESAAAVVVIGVDAHNTMLNDIRYCYANSNAIFSNVECMMFFWFVLPFISQPEFFFCLFLVFGDTSAKLVIRCPHPMAHLYLPGIMQRKAANWVAETANSVFVALNCKIF
jgi:hypothetical protein